MTTVSRLKWFAAFTAVFAVCAAALFWGTWSPDVVPVMPDSPTTFPTDHLSRIGRWILSTGKVYPTDFLEMVGGPYAWVEFRYVLALYFAGLGLAYFCRGRGLSPLASYGAGLLLAFCGYWATLFSAGHLGWFRWMTYGVFAFGLADRAVVRGGARYWLLLGLFVSWAGFNQQDLWLLFSIFTAAYLVYACARERKLPWKGALLALAAFTLVGLPNFRETLATTLKGREEQIGRNENVTNRTASEADRRWEFVTNWSMPVEDTAEFVCSRVHGDTLCPFVLSVNRAAGIRPYTGALGRPMNAKTGAYRQHSLYVGWVTCLLALAGLALGFRRGDVRFFAGAAVVCYLLSLGRHFEPAYRIVFMLPFGDLIRCPVKWHHLTEFSLVVLAAFGVEGLLAALRRLNLSWLRPELLLAAVMAFGVFDLVTEARRYCAPVNVAAARRLGLESQMAILQRADFQNPQIAELVKRGLIVSVANYMGNPGVFVVQILRPFDPPPERPVSPLTLALGALSALTAVGILFYALKSRGSGDCLSDVSEKA